MTTTISTTANLTSNLTSSSTQTTASSSPPLASSTTINAAAPGATQNYDPTVTKTFTLGSSVGYSISFSPSYWLCTDVQVTFTGPLVERGLYGDMLQFQYFQYSPDYPSVLTPLWTDSGLAVTSDTVTYVISASEYASVNFEYLPNIAVKVVDVTPKSNGYMPGQIFFQLTNIIPEGYGYCQNIVSVQTPEFQDDWIITMVSVALALIFLQAHNHKHRLVRTKKLPN
jgi:hypothetical protein